MIEVSLKLKQAPETVLVATIVCYGCMVVTMVVLYNEHY